MNAILREEKFMDLDFLVNDRVLNPRPETELLVETGLSILRTGCPPRFFGEPPRRHQTGKDSSVLDIGTGSGCVAISIGSFEPRVRITAVDLSAEALELAQENAARLKLADRIDFRESDLFSAFDLKTRFDVILSNPPYIAENEWEELPPEVKQEPRLALWGGRNGLETIERLIAGAPSHLVPGGWLALEIGFRQAAGVKTLLEQMGFADITVLKDFSGIERIVAARHGRI